MGSGCWREWGERAARAKAVRTALYMLLATHNKRFPEKALELSDGTYAKAPSYFERARGQVSVPNQLAYKQVPAKTYSNGVYHLIVKTRANILEGKAETLPSLIREIDLLGEGFVETAPALPKPPKPPAAS